MRKMVLAGEKRKHLSHILVTPEFTRKSKSFLIYLPKSKGHVLSQAGNKTQFCSPDHKQLFLAPLLNPLTAELASSGFSEDRCGDVYLTSIVTCTKLSSPSLPQQGPQQRPQASLGFITLARTSGQSMYTQWVLFVAFSLLFLLFLFYNWVT